MKCSIVIVCLLFALLASCDRPECTNTNPVFDKYSLWSKEYRNELAKQITRAGPSGLSYWIGYYNREEKNTYATIYVQGKGICALMPLDITHGKG